jgi:hypothetical protein
MNGGKKTFLMEAIKLRGSSRERNRSLDPPDKNNFQLRS